MALKDRLKKFDLLPEIEEDSVEKISPELVAVCNELSKALSVKIASIPVWFEYSKEEQKTLILNFLNTKLNEAFSEIRLTPAEKDRISAVILSSIYGFGSLDFLIAQRGVNTIIVNSNENILVELNGEIVNADIVIDKNQLQMLIRRLLDMSGKISSVVSFRFNDLLVTILAAPVCQQKLILKKLDGRLFNFEYFEEKQILNEDIAEFLKVSLSSGKKFLISAPSGVGKTKFINAFLNEMPEDKHIILFEECELINTAKQNLERFDISTLCETDKRHLLKAGLCYKPNYIFSDTNDIGFNIEVADQINEKSGFVASVAAESPLDAMNFYTAVQASRLKCTEKFAKIKFAKYFDYVIQLEKRDDSFVINTILEVSSNKAGTPVLTEKLTFNSGEYKYDFPAIEMIVPPADADSIDDGAPRKKLSFRARFAE